MALVECKFPAGSIPVMLPTYNSRNDTETQFNHWRKHLSEDLTNDQWRRIAVEALADLQSIGMDIRKLKFVQGFPDTVLKEVERYFWNREEYS